MPPTGSIKDPSQESTRCSRSVGRMKPSSGPDHRRARNHQDGAEHQGRPAGHVQQQAGEHSPEGQGDGHPHHDQPDHHPPGVAAQLSQVQRHARVVEDDGDRERNQRLEGAPQQLLRVDVGGDRTGDEAGRQQDDRRDLQKAGEHLRTGRQREDQAHPEQDLIGCHGSFQFSALRSSIGSPGPGSCRRRENSQRRRPASIFSTQRMSWPLVRRANPQKRASRPGSVSARSRSMPRRIRS